MKLQSLSEDDNYCGEKEGKGHGKKTEQSIKSESTVLRIEIEKKLNLIYY